MIRSAALIGLLAGLVALTSGTASAESASRHIRKPAHPAKAAAPAPSAAGNINAPSTDFSKVDRAEDDATGGSTGDLKPVMGPSGNIGLGGGF